MYDLLAQPLTQLAGIGPALGKRLENRGCVSVGDLLLHLPKHYVDDRFVTPIARLRPGQAARVVGQVIDRQSRGGRKMAQTIIVIEDDSGERLLLHFFNSPYLLRDGRLTEGRTVSVRGLPEPWQGVMRMTHPEWGVDGGHESGFQPIYPALAGLSGRRLGHLIQSALRQLPLAAHSPLDPFLTGQPSLLAALRLLHHPGELGPDSPEIKAARRRLQLEELLLYLYLMLQKRAAAEIDAPVLRERQLQQRLIARLPHPLTEAQSSVLAEIASDLASGKRMHRLLQGDVGAGKTWVAALALLQAVGSNRQAALMAPTEVLAEQHAAGLTELLAPLSITPVLLTGSTRAAARRKILADLASGAAMVAIGTHALIGEEVRFARLGLAIVDEQHRFGVRQRWALAERGESVHLLGMTATPIPRTLALALYGDMRLSLMRGLPPGRKPVETTVLSASSTGKLIDGMRRILDGGGRIYWIVPRIDEEEEEGAESGGVSVAQRAEMLARALPDGGVLPLHGRMSSSDKRRALDAFSKGESRVLVSTTVVEVGVNVPEARLIVIEQADHYGLAQLHQLRGRVGRSGEQGYCVLLIDGKASSESVARLKKMAGMHDGLELAELDLTLRGAGDALGVNQSGESGFRLLDPGRDAALIRDWYERVPEFEPGEAMIRFWRPLAESVD